MQFTGPKKLLQSYAYSQFFARSLKFFRRNEVSEEKPEVSEDKPDLSTTPPEDVGRMRDKSRLSIDIKTRYFKKELAPFEGDYYFQIDKLRELYGEFGKQSGVNPGVCWPTQEELQLQKENEALAYQSLQTMVQNIKIRKQKADTLKKKKDKEAEGNMIKLQKLNQENQERLAKKEAAAEAQRLQKEMLVDQIREELGYHINPNDPRYTEIMIRREEQQKKAAKEAKKKKMKEDRIEQIKELAGEKKVRELVDDSSDDESSVKKK